jgi:hypothetical protein
MTLDYSQFEEMLEQPEEYTREEYRELERFYDENRDEYDLEETVRDALGSPETPSLRDTRLLSILSDNDTGGENIEEDCKINSQENYLVR